jgi:hypothetical protein
MHRVQQKVLALAILGFWIGQGLLLFGLAVHVAEHHHDLTHARTGLGSVLHGHVHAEDTPEHSHDLLPAELFGGTSKQAKNFWPSVLSFVPRGGQIPFANEVLSASTTAQAMSHGRISGTQSDTGPPLYDFLCILLI